MPTSKSWASINGHSLRYELVGAGQQTIVLCHEMGGAMESWDRVIDMLSARYQVLRYDQRGAGLSEKIERLEFSVMLEDLDALLDHVGIVSPVHLVGAAAGAAIAVQYAVAHPERVASLTLSNPALNVPADRRAYLLDRADLAAEKGMAAVERVSLSNSYPDSVRQDSAPYLAYRGLFLGNDPRSYGALNRAFATVDASHQLIGVPCPMLILAGTVDQLRPPALIREMLKGNELIEFEEIEGGHILPVQAPELFARRVLSFLDAGCGSDALPDSPRIALVNDTQYTQRQAEVANSIAGGPRGRVSPPFRAWLSSPEFAQAAQELGAFVRYRTGLGKPVSETAILVVADHWSCRYEWHIHAAEAEKAGVQREVLDVIRRGTDPAGIDVRLALTIKLVRAVLANSVDARLYEGAHASFGAAGLVELIGLTGYYSMMAMTLNTFQILPETMASQPS